MILQTDFLSYLYHLYFKFYLPKTNDVTARLSCAIGFVEVVIS